MAREQPTPVRTAAALALALAALATLALAVAGDAAAKPRKAKLDLQLEHTGIIKKDAYGELPRMTRKGAMAGNIGSGGFYLSHQHLGDLYVRAGIVHRRPKAIRRGFRAFGYAFRRQRPDGSFREDQAEGYAFFVEAVAHSVLLLQKTRYRGKFSRAIRRSKRSLRRAVPHMIESTAFAAFKDRNPSYTHSGYSVGTALGLAARLLHERTFERKGRRAIKEALGNQWRNGVNPELGGPDVRYQMAGLVYAERFSVYFPGGALTRRVERMARRGLEWMDRRVDSDGYIRWRGSTRACRERGTNGKVKTPGYSFAVRGFAYWGRLNDRPGYLRTARDLHAYSERVNPRRQCGPKVKRKPRRDRGGEGGGGGDGGGGLLDDVLPPAEARQLVP